MRKEKASRATLFELPDIYVTFGSGEKIFIKPDPAKVVLEIKTGKNLVNNHMISLYDGLENIYCGKLKEKTSLLKATTGFYMLSDTLYPGDPHFLVFTAGMRKNLRSFFDSLAPSIGMNPKKFNLDIDFTAIPKNLVGSKRSSQSFYRFTGMIGYDITLANFNPGFYVGYLYYTSKDNYYGDTGLIGVLGSPFVAITLLYKYRIAEKFILQNILKLFPAILKQLSAFGFENVLSLEYPLGKSRSLYFDYRKTIFRYSKKDPEESVLENMDSFLCGAGIKF